MTDETRALLAYPNLLDATFYTPYIWGGSYVSNKPVTNLADRLLVNLARTSSKNEADTKFEFDLGSLRDVRVASITHHTIQRGGKVRYEYSRTAKWVGAKVVGAHSAADTTIDMVSTGASPITMTAGDALTFAGHSTLYIVQSNVVVATSGTTSVTIAQSHVGGGLSATLANDEVVTCRSGDFTSPVRDSGLISVWDRVYTRLPYGSASWYSGRASGEDAARMKVPSVDLAPAAFRARYGRVSISNTSNSNNYIDLMRFHISPGWVVPINPAYGLKLMIKSNTTVSRTQGNARFYEIQENEREFGFNIMGLTFDEGMSQAYELYDQLGLDKQLFFMLRPDDSINRHRLSGLFNMKQVDGLEMAFYNGINAPFNMEEVVE